VSVNVQRASKWLSKPLGEVFEVVGGGTPSKQEASYYGGDIPWATIRDMGSSHLSATEHSITRLGLANSSSNLIPAGEVLMATRVGLGKACILMQETAINQDIRALIPREDGAVDRRFLLYWLQSVADEVVAAGTGATVQGVTLPFIKGLSFPSISVGQQKRIVAVLDQAFAALDCARTNAEANLVDAQEVYLAELQLAFAEVGEARGLGSLCDVFADGDWIESKDQSSGGVRLIQTGNVGVGVFKDRSEKARYVSEDTFKRLRCTEIFEGDCLISRLPDPVGRSCILPSTGEKMITAVDCTIVRFDTKLMLPAFFNHYAQSGRYFDVVSQKCTGTTRNRISRSNLAFVPVPVPPIPKQRAIVAALDKMRDEVLSLRDFYAQKLTNIAALRQSLLQAAFSGQLT
jgi:type I restriction enzyme S subunit